VIKTILACISMFTAVAPAVSAAESDTSIRNKDYLYVGLQSSYPVAESRKSFSSGYRHPSLTYMHEYSDRWIMGLGINFKILYRTDTKEDVAIAALSHEIARRIRLSYPTFLDIGNQVMYLLPSEIAAFPLRRSADFRQEIGAGIFAGITHHLADNTVLGIRIGRWRGTGSKKIQCIESTAIIGWTLN
jgi:hypothetical protein